eukprot:gnl/TRDRNA2_/TRDRNA2_182865_c0_seq1.p1 gnl/TRDRNA2_/TRDRNA2_182865_c0~~gnl/TRDRNA2_/TRDRNA2_182865_c0_seq1.p1  ORF type:complete len:555 (+),score=98.51 gnl/TRDRNA2_/TRDRNA2_182865_c0_seq1:61-1725(+)
MPAMGSWDPLKIPDGLTCKNTFFDIPSTQDMSVASGPATCPLPAKGWRNLASSPTRRASSDPTPTFAINDLGASPDWYDGSIFSAMLDPLKVSECFDRNDKITTFDLPPVGNVSHFDSDRICDSLSCGKNFFDIPSADDFPPTPCRSCSGNSLPLLNDMFTGSKPFFDIPSADDPVRTPMSRTSRAASEPSPPIGTAPNRSCQDLSSGLQDRVNIIFDIPDVGSSSSETGPATCPLPTEGWWSAGSSSGDQDKDSSAPTIVSTPTPEYDVTSRTGTDRSSPGRSFDKLLADATADMPDGLPSHCEALPLPFPPLPLPPFGPPLPPHPSMLLPPFVPPLPMLSTMQPPLLPWGMAPMLPDMSLPPPFLADAGLGGVPEVRFPDAESLAAEIRFGEIPGLPLLEVAPSAEAPVFDTLLPELPLPVLPYPALPLPTDLGGPCGESVLVQLARELGIASPVAASTQDAAKLDAATFTSDSADTSAAADEEKIVLIPALKVRRRRGSKLAKDPDRGEEPEERMPTFVEVDLGDLVRVKRSARRADSESSCSEQPPAEQP